MSVVAGLLGGLLILILSGDALVRGAVALANRLGVPALVVSLTVVGFGTSAPELVVSFQAALRGESGIAIGNIVGSNIVNVLLILGLPALFIGLDATRADARASLVIMLGAALLFGLLAWDGTVGRLDGAILLASLGAMILHTLRSDRQERPDGAAGENDAPLSSATTAGLLVAGLVGLPLGAHLFIGAAVDLAEALAIPDEVIGLTLVAAGTSLPELSATAIAAWRRRPDVAIGNVIGSNIFNILGILGVTALAVPMPVPGRIMAGDFWIMVGTSLLLVPAVFAGMRFSRPTGAVLTGLYAGYAIWLLD